MTKIVTLLCIMVFFFSQITFASADDYGYDKADDILSQDEQLNAHDRHKVKYIIEELRYNNYEDAADDLEHKLEQRDDDV